MSSPRVTGGPRTVYKGRPSLIFVSWAALFGVGVYSFLWVKSNNRKAGQRFLAEYNNGDLNDQDAEQQAGVIRALEKQRAMEDSAEAPITSLIKRMKGQAKNFSLSG